MLFFNAASGYCCVVIKTGSPAGSAAQLLGGHEGYYSRKDLQK